MMKWLETNGLGGDAATVCGTNTRTSPGRMALSGIAEIFDGQSSHDPKGCVNQAWSVVEVLRRVITRQQFKPQQPEISSVTFAHPIPTIVCGGLQK